MKSQLALFLRFRRGFFYDYYRSISLTIITYPLLRKLIKLTKINRMTLRRVLKTSRVRRIFSVAFKLKFATDSPTNMARSSVIMKMALDPALVIPRNSLQVQV